jgi:hypothetical protein
MSTLTAGSLFGSLLCGLLLKFFGRRACMIIADILGMLGALLTT